MSALLDFFGFLFDAVASVVSGGAGGAVRVARRERSASRAFTEAVDAFARDHRAENRGGRRVVMIEGIEVAASVVASEHRGRTWFAQVEANVVGRVGAELHRGHSWLGPLPAVTRTGTESRSFPALDAAWREIIRHGARVVIVSDGRRVVGWVDEPLTGDDVARVAAAVAAIARWDAGYATLLTKLPDATPFDDRDLSPGVRLAPDGLRIGIRGRATVARLQGVIPPAGGILPAETAAHIARTGAELFFGHGGAEVFWPEIVHDRDRLLAAVAALRSLRSDGGPYR